MLRRLFSVLVLAALLFAILPAAAQAAPVIPSTADARFEGFVPSDDPAHVAAGVSAPAEMPITFGLVGFTLPEGADVDFRASADGVAWEDWVALEPLGDEGPDATEEADSDWENMSDAFWVGEARWLQVRVHGGEVGGVVAHLVDTKGLSASFWQRTVDAVRSALRGSVGSAAAAPVVASTGGPVPPRFVTRAEWGADESLRGDAPAYARPRAVIVHHTGDTNDYTPEDGPAIVRGVYHLHTQVRGWRDIGYNVLVDRYGVVYEGRAGGLDQAVVGSHARGFNYGTFGLSIMGNFSHESPPPAALEAAARVIAWKFDIHGIDVAGHTEFISGGSTLYPPGSYVRLPTIFGHRNVAITECPGDYLSALLPAIRQRVLELGPRFVDVSAAIHREAIDVLVDIGIVAGCEERRFCPDRIVTRAQLATLLARATQQPPSGETRFTDAVGSVHDGAINGLAAAGVIKGCTDDSFCPDQPVTRAQLATLLVRAFDDLRPRGRERFTDIARSPHRGAINGLAAAGVANGCGEPGKFCPDALVTRAQAATFLARALARPSSGEPARREPRILARE